ncbi:MAG: hypothetical protein IJV62_02510 [Eggerthellaceae bacterium]|nr:hypothetical protein [Eggerthellaceae bacterium]
MENTFGAFEQRVTFLSDEYVAIYTSAGHFAGGAHGWSQQDMYIYDLTDANREVSIEETISLSKGQIEEFTKMAVRAYLTGEAAVGVGHGLYSYDEIEALNNFWKSVEDGLIVLIRDDTGIKAFFGQYVMGDYASGVHVLQICDADGNPVADGTRAEFTFIGEE